MIKRRRLSLKVITHLSAPKEPNFRIHCIKSYETSTFIRAKSDESAEECGTKSYKNEDDVFRFGADNVDDAGALSTFPATFTMLPPESIFP